MSQDEKLKIVASQLEVVEEEQVTASVDEDLKAEDKDIEEVLNENSRGND